MEYRICFAVRRGESTKINSTKITNLSYFGNPRKFIPSKIPCLTVSHVRMFSRPTILFLVSLLFVALLNSIPTYFLNQARAGRRPVHAWFLEIAFVWEVSMRVYVDVCVCVSAPEAINN